MAALALAAAPAASAGPAPSAEPEPRLVLVLAIDQLRRDRLDPALPGGLGRLAREGRVYTNGVLDHARTETCPGHASIATGRHPGPAGVPGNHHTKRETGERVYCVEDPSESSAVFGESAGRSPLLLRASTLGDWMKQARPSTRVFTVAGKDRTAIVLGGHRADGAYWFSREAGFTTSRYYRDSVPDWVTDFNARLRELVPEEWVHPSHDPEHPDRPDDYPAESDDFSRTSPHPIHADSFAAFARNLYFTPYLDLLTLELASALVAKEDLGSAEGVDLLGVGLSATDTVGHLYGPESLEARAALRALDRALGRFLLELEARVGAGRVLVAVSADHGVLALPEWLVETGRSECPVEGGRAGMRRVGLGLSWHLHWRFSLFSVPKEWIHIAGSSLTVDRPLAAKHDVEVAEVARAAREYLEEREEIRKVWTGDEIEASSDEFARLFRNSRDPERSGDLEVQLEPTCLLSPFDHGTTHGTPYLYDRAVPIVFWGPGVPPGRVSGPAATVDIAPTLAKRLGVSVPADLDGQALFD